MEQEHASLLTLQAQQKTFESRAATYGTLAKKLTAFQTAVAVRVVGQTSGLTASMQTVVDAYNDLIEFSEEQNLAASRGEGSSIARDPVLRGLRAALRDTLSAEYLIGGEYRSVSAIGLEFDRSGRLSFTPAAVRGALQGDDMDAGARLAAENVAIGVFPAVSEVLATYTGANGLLEGMKTGLEERARSLTSRIAALRD